MTLAVVLWNKHQRLSEKKTLEIAPKFLHVRKSPSATLSHHADQIQDLFACDEPPQLYVMRNVLENEKMRTW
jgi:hypothetical protein